MGIAAPYTIIRASAGSGKTFQLSSQLIRLIVLGESPEKILATTFTRKAAGEILARVYVRIARATQSEDAALALSHELEIAPRGSAAWQVVLKRIVATQHALRIRTMDSFALQVALAFGYDAPLPPGWKIGSDEVMNQLAEQALTALFDEQSEQTREDLYYLLQQSRGASEKISLYETLLSDVRMLATTYGDATKEAWGAFFWIKPTCDQQQVIDMLRQMPIPCSASSKKPNLNWIKARDALIEKLSTGAWKELAESGLFTKVLEGDLTYYSFPLEEQHVEVISELIAHTSEALLAPLQSRVRALRTLLENYQTKHTALQWQQGVVSLADIKTALGKVSHDISLEHLFFRLDSQVHHVLLDEFQDTSLSEWRVVEPFAREVLSGREDRTFLCVGDLKQGIYRWRGAAPEVFHLVEKSWPTLTPRVLDVSRRSAPEVIAFVNKIFATIDTNEALKELSYREGARAWKEGFNLHQAHRTDLQGFVSVTWLETPVNGVTPPQITERESSEESDESDLFSDMTLRARAIRDLARAHPRASIGIITRTNKDLAHIVYELRKLGCPVSDEGQSTLLDSRAVVALVAVLRFIDHPGCSEALALIESTPLGRSLSLSTRSSEAYLRDRAVVLRADLINQGAAPWIATLVQQMESVLTPRDRMRVEQLTSFLASTPHLQRARPRKIAEQIARYKTRATEDTQIRALTIHASKGLEFDIVVLPALEGKLLSTDRFIKFRKSLTEPYSCVALSAAKPVIRLSPQLHFARAHEEQEKTCEALSMLYVALTRARSGLFIYLGGVSKKRNGCTFSSILKAALQAELPQEGVTWECGDKAQLIERFAPQTQKNSEADAEAVSLPALHRITLHAPSGGASRVLHRIKPSLTTTEQGKRRDPESMLFGTAVHGMLKEIAWSDNLTTLTQQLSEHRLPGVPLQICKRAAAFIIKLFDDPQFAELFAWQRLSREIAQISLWRERPYACMVEEGMMSGVFDRVAFTPEQGEILDFKITRGDLQIYRPQLVAYQLALHKLTGLPLQSIAAKIVGLSSDGVKVVSL
jgi:ATP-dependent helicase/nuclease subunit A